MSKPERSFSTDISPDLARSLMPRIEARCEPCPVCGGLAWRGNCQTKMYHASIETNKVRYPVRYVAWYAGGGRELNKRDLLTTSCDEPTCINFEFIKATTKAGIIGKSMREGKIHNAAHKLSRIKKRRERGDTKMDIEKARQLRASDMSNAEAAMVWGVSRTFASLVRRNLAYKDVSPFAGLGAR